MTVLNFIKGLIKSIVLNKENRSNDYFKSQYSGDLNHNTPEIKLGTLRTFNCFQLEELCFLFRCSNKNVNALARS